MNACNRHFFLALVLLSTPCRIEAMRRRVNPLTALRLLLLLSTVTTFYVAQPSTAIAQGTAFSYQGRLNDGTNPATRVYDLRFTVYDAVTNGNAWGVLTNAATAVSNGLFAVTLDFGAGVFTGPGRWLQLDVRTNGAAAFTTLVPRQPLLPVPYAVMANSASNLLGTLPAAQLSGTFVSPTLSYPVVSNGVVLAPLTPIPCLSACGLSGVLMASVGNYMQFVMPVGDSLTTGSGNIAGIPNESASDEMVYFLQRNFGCAGRGGGGTIDYTVGQGIVAFTRPETATWLGPNSTLGGFAIYASDGTNGLGTEQGVLSYGHGTTSSNANLCRVQFQANTWGGLTAMTVYSPTAGYTNYYTLTNTASTNLTMVIDFHLPGTANDNVARFTQLIGHQLCYVGNRLSAGIGHWPLEELGRR
jgi:hypothetical protein